jgi:hypothetical protein
MENKEATHMGQGHSETEGAKLDSVARHRIGRRLRAQYRSLTGAPIPNEHVDLLLTLRQVERERNRNTNQ